MTDDKPPPERADDRVFLLVVDDTEEMWVALRYACQRAHNSHGRVALLYVMESSEFQHWMAVGDLMREEARSEGEQLLQRVAAQAMEQTGVMPVLYLREGSRRSELLKLIDEEPSISILVLGASIEQRGCSASTTNKSGSNTSPSERRTPVGAWKTSPRPVRRIFPKSW